MTDIQRDAVPPARVLEATLRNLVAAISGEIGDRDLIATAVLACTEVEKLKAEAAKAPRLDLTVNQILQAIEFATGGFHPDTEDELETSMTFSIGPLKDDDGKVVADGMHCWLTDLAGEGAIPLDEYPSEQDLAKAQAPQQAQAEARHALTPAARDVLAERQRQISAEGYNPDHDDEHSDGSLSVAAACYALANVPGARPGTLSARYLAAWVGWGAGWFKPSNRRRNLEKACALLLADMERIDRAAIAAAKVSGATPAHYLVDEHYPTEASERGAQAAQGGES